MNSISIFEIETDIKILQSIHNQLERIYLDLESRPYSSRLQIQFKVEMKKSFEFVERIIRKSKLSDDIDTQKGAQAMKTFKELCLETESIWRRGLRLLVRQARPPRDPPSASSSSSTTPHLVETTIPPDKDISIDDIDAIFLSEHPRDELRNRIIRVNGDLEYLLDLAAQANSLDDDVVGRMQQRDDHKEKSDQVHVRRPGLSVEELEDLGTKDSSLLDSISTGTVLRTAAFAVAGGVAGVLVGGPVAGFAFGMKAATLGAAGGGAVGAIGGAGVGVVGGQVADEPERPRRQPYLPTVLMNRSRVSKKDSDEEDDPLLELTDRSERWDARPESFD